MSLRLGEGARGGIERQGLGETGLWSGVPEGGELAAAPSTGV